MTDTHVNFADVSVIIPAFNAAETIKRALISVGEQTTKPREIVVVDDGSSDGTYEIAKATTPYIPGIKLKVLRQSNFGAGAARNLAIKESSHSLIAFLDADDEWLPEKLRHSVENFEKNDYTLVAHNSILVDGLSEAVIDCASRFEEASSPFISLYCKGFLDTSTVVVKRSALIDAGGFDESLSNAQDFEMWLSILKHPQASFLVFDDVLSRYHIIPGSIMSNTGQRITCCLKVARQFMPSLANHTNNPLRYLWYRVVAIYYEAFRAFLSKREYPNSLGVCMRLPGRLLVATLEHFLCPVLPRRNYLNSKFMPAQDVAPLNASNDRLSLALYLWTSGALLLYLLQFRELIRPVLRTLGIL